MSRGAAKTIVRLEIPSLTRSALEGCKPPFLKRGVIRAFRLAVASAWWVHMLYITNHSVFLASRHFRAGAMDALKFNNKPEKSLRVPREDKVSSLKTGSVYWPYEEKPGQLRLCFL